jgi:hypothetical protein
MNLQKTGQRLTGFGAVLDPDSAEHATLPNGWTEPKRPLSKWRFLELGILLSQFLAVGCYMLGFGPGMRSMRKRTEIIAEEK